MKVIVYDDKGIFSSPRAWWMFRVMGHEDVAVLNGVSRNGSPRGVPWKAAPRPRSARHFTPRRNSELVREISDMLRVVQAGKPQIVDARSNSRFLGHEVDIWARGATGRHAGRVHRPRWHADRWQWDHEIRRRIARRVRGRRHQPRQAGHHQMRLRHHGLQLALGLAILGNEYAAVYDGSWAEWASVPSAPAVTD